MDLGDTISLAQLAKRPGVTADVVSTLLPEHLQNGANDPDLRSALADLLYAGYLESHNLTVNHLYQHDSLRIPSDIAFGKISGLSNEIIERLDRAKPTTFGAARRLPGLTAGALSTLLVFLSARNPTAV
jgi:tRNA uridine 5-carboxymethylaminomethyl modification enzyme